MKAARALCALLTCAVLYANSEVSSGAPDEPGFKAIAGSYPCPSSSPPGPLQREREKLDEIEWYQALWTRICIESVRSDAVTLLLARGLDEHGVPLETDARARRLAEMEGWLGGLVGKFRIEGKRWNETAPTLKDMQVRGTADCLKIGSGPGVLCLLSADRKPDEKSGKGRSPVKVPDVAIRPQLLLFGLHPGAMEIRVTHMDFVAVEMRGILQDGAVILSEQTPPQVVYSAPLARLSSLREDRDNLIAMGKGTFQAPINHDNRTSLNSLPVDDDGNLPRRVSRIAMTQSGDVDMKFHVFSPYDWGRLSVLPIEGSPVEFDLQLHREPQLDADAQEPVATADFTCAKLAGSSKQQGLDDAEVASAGIKESGTGQMQAWLARLVGQYTVEGYVDLCGKGNPADQRQVTGKVDCIAAGSSPSVHCRVDVSWPPETREKGAPVPGGISNLAPAQFLFSLFTHELHEYDGATPGEPTGGADRRGLQFLQLDSQGVTEKASSELADDTFMSREKCVDMPGNCHKTTRIVARPDSNEISMQVDVEVNRERVLRQTFLLRRELQ